MLPQWALRQIAAFVAQFVRSDGSAWIGVGSREGFETVDRTRAVHRLIRDLGPGAHAVPLAGLDPARGFVFVPSGKGAEPELWLDPTLRGYRAAYELFARRWLGAAGLAGANVQIDHVFPKKAGALDGLAFVRMLAIDPQANMGAGRTVERGMAGMAAAAPAPKLVRHATYVSIGKATGFVGWQSMPDTARASANLPAVQALFTHLRGFGLPASVLTRLDRGLTANRLRSLR